MNRKRMLLLRMLLLSTSRINRIRKSSDKKVKRKTISYIVGMGFVFLVMMFWVGATSVFFGYVGMAKSIPVVCSAMLSILAVVLTLFKSNGYLFNFKEYDMLMSLPFSPKSIAADKFLYMYITSLPWDLCISLAMMAVYGYYEKPGFAMYPVWIILTLFVPVIPTVLASFIGFLIAKISSRFKKKRNIVQTIVSFAFILLCFSFQFIVEAVMKNSNTKVVMSNISDGIEGVGKWYFPIKWFVKAVRETDVLSIVLLIIVSLVVFELVFMLVGRYYRQINSALGAHKSTKSFKLKQQKSKSVVNAIAFKEFKRLTGSNVYMINGIIGEVLCAVLAIVVLIIGFDKIVSGMLKGAPISAEAVFPAIPVFIHFLVGMVPTTTCSPSLEGKNYWILQSLPITRKQIYQGKMLFNMYATLPVALISTFCICMSAKVPAMNFVIYMIEVTAFCCLSTAWGCACGVRHMKLDWENEVEVIKQGVAVFIYMFPNMIIAVGLMVAAVAFGQKVDSNLISAGITAVAGLLAALSYWRVMNLAKK